MAEPIIKYKITSKNYTPEIVTVEVIRETQQCVWVMPDWGTKVARREAKNSEWADYFDTFEQAKSFLVDHWEEKVKQIRMDLERKKSILGNIKGMKGPKNG